LYITFNNHPKCKSFRNSKDVNRLVGLKYKIQLGFWFVCLFVCLFLSVRNSLQWLKPILLKSERMRKIYHENGTKYQAGVAILISDKIRQKRRRRSPHSNCWNDPSR
jgi:hypothetical protein